MRPTHPPVQALGTITLHYHKHALRVVIDTAGGAHYTGADLSRILGYSPGSGLSDPHRATLGHFSTVMHGRRQQLALTDVGLDYLLSVSQKPEAAPFRDWIDAHARPIIRRHVRRKRGEALGDALQAHAREQELQALRQQRGEVQQQRGESLGDALQALAHEQELQALREQLQASQEHLDDVQQELLDCQRAYAEVVQERDTALSRLAALTPARSRTRTLLRRFLGRGV